MHEPQGIGRFRWNFGASQRERRCYPPFEQIGAGDFRFVETPDAGPDLRGGTVRRPGEETAVGGPDAHAIAGVHQADRHGDETVLHGRAPARAAKALPDPRNGEGEHARRAAHRGSRHHRASQASHFPADQADHENIRPGCRLGEREQIGELRAAHPSVYFHDAAMHLGKHGDCAADRDQRKSGEIHCELRERLFAHFRLQTAAATLKGAAPRRNTTRGRRMSAMPMKVITANRAIPERSRRLVAILKPMATTRPAAAAEIPRNDAETAGRWPYWVWSAPNARMMKNGAVINPANAANAPQAPR